MSFKAVLATNAAYRVANVIVLFATTAILSRAMGVEGYGLLSLLILNTALFNMFTSLGIDSGITYSTALNAGQTNRVVTISLVLVALQVVLLLLVDLLCLAATGHLWLLKTANLQEWWLGALFLTSISLQEKFAALLNGSHLYTKCNRSILFCNLFTLLLFCFFFFVAEERSFQLYLMLYIFTTGLLAFFLLYISKKSLHFLLDKQLSKKVLAPFFNYSILVFVTNSIQFLAYRADFWFIDYFRNERELGWYALAVRLVQLLWIIPILLSSIIFPKVSSAQEKYSHHEMIFLLRILNTVNIVAGLVLFFCIQPLLIFFFGQPFAPSIPAFQILLSGVILFANATILAAYFAGINALRVNLWGSVLCLISITILDLLLIPGQGYLGAALASSIGYGLTAFYFILFYCKKQNLPFVSLFWLRKEDWKQLQSFRHQFTFQKS